MLYPTELRAHTLSKVKSSRTGEQICRLLSVSKKVGLLVFVRNDLSSSSPIHYGTTRGTRTLNPVRATDFKSVAYTNSAMVAKRTTSSSFSLELR